MSSSSTQRILSGANAYPCALIGLASIPGRSACSETPADGAQQVDFGAVLGVLPDVIAAPIRIPVELAPRVGTTAVDRAIDIVRHLPDLTKLPGALVADLKIVRATPEAVAKASLAERKQWLDTLSDPTNGIIPWLSDRVLGNGSVTNSYWALPILQASQKQMLAILKSATSEGEFDALYFSIDSERWQSVLTGQQIRDLATLVHGHYQHKRGDWTSFPKYLEDLTSLPASSGNDVRFLANGSAVAEGVVADLRSAEKSILVEVFQLETSQTDADGVRRPDRYGKGLLDELAAAAARGVKVRLLLDENGTSRTELERLLADSLAALAPAQRARARLNLKVVFDRIPLTQGRLDHRKLLVVDGTRGWTGGMNVGESYQVTWYDQQTRHDGPVVAQFADLFVKRWNEAAKAAAFGFGSETLVARDPALFSAPAEHPNGDTVSVVAHDGAGLDENTKAMFLAAIRRAKTSIEIGAPYFAEDDVTDALIAAKRDGVVVDVYVPATESNDQKTVALAALPQLKRLLDAGVTIHETRMFHYKVGVFDGAPSQTFGKASDDTQGVSIYGSSNLDVRSLRFNFELDAAVHGKARASEIREVLFGNQLREKTTRLLTRERLDALFRTYGAQIQILHTVRRIL